MIGVTIARSTRTAAADTQNGGVIATYDTFLLGVQVFQATRKFAVSVLQIAKENGTRTA
jgi:hypothetical protein